MCHSTSHRACHCPGSGSLSRVARNCTDRGSSRRPSRSSPDTCALYLLRVVGGLLLGRLLLFLTKTLWWRGLRIDSGSLLGHAVALAFILQLLVGILTVLRKCEHANLLRR